MKRIEPSSLGRIWEKAFQLEQAGREICHFEIGRPDFDTPAPIKAAALKAMEAGQVHYTVPRGLIELREAIAEDQARRQGLRLDPAREIMVTVGAVEGLTSLFLTVLEPGDEILVPEPMYPFYLEWGEFLSSKTVQVPTFVERGYQPAAEDLLARITERTKILIVNSPHNPTGNGLGQEALEALAQVAREKDLLVVSDEVYDRLTYPPFEHRSIATLPGMAERTVIINSFSKPFAMDGWRVGYLIGPAELIAEMDKAHLRAATCANSMAQHAAVEALRLGEELVAPMREEYQKRRKVVLEMIDQAPGLSAYRPQGAFYLWLNYGRLKVDDWELAEALLERAGVAVTPGFAFGPSGRGHLRLSYAASLEDLEKGVPRLIKVIEELR